MRKMSSFFNHISKRNIGYMDLKRKNCLNCKKSIHAQDCWLSAKRMKNSSFKEIDIETFLKMWDDNRIQFFCCECYYKIRKFKGITINKKLKQ